MQIASGCMRQCSYCAIRFATGPVRSKPLDRVTRTLTEAMDLGHRKLELHADSLGDYGVDIGTDLGALLDWLANCRREVSVGLHDLHPEAFVRFFDRVLLLCDAGKVHYLYVPLQSGNPRVLQAMNRWCDLEDLTRKLLAVRRLPGTFLQTSIIVGFPGETDGEFGDTVALLGAVRFDDVWVHCYTDMPNTESSRMSGKVDKRTMLDRLRRLDTAGLNHDRDKTLREWEGVPSVTDGVGTHRPLRPQSRS